MQESLQQHHSCCCLVHLLQKAAWKSWHHDDCLIWTSLPSVISWESASRSTLCANITIMSANAVVHLTTATCPTIVKLQWHSNHSWCSVGLSWIANTVTATDLVFGSSSWLPTVCMPVLLGNPFEAGQTVPTSVQATYDHTYYYEIACTKRLGQSYSWSRFAITNACEQW